MQPISVVRVSIPDVAVDMAEGNLSFKLVFLMNQSSDFEAGVAPVTVELFRSYPQCLWLYNQLLEDNPDRILPAFPDRPTSSDTGYLEKKRLQMERFMTKLFSRKSFVESNRHVSYFMNPSMTSFDVKPEKSKLVNKVPFIGSFRSDIRDGFKIFVPSNVVEARADQDLYEERRSMIAEMDDLLGSMLGTFMRSVKCREATAKAIQQVAYALKDCKLLDELETVSMPALDEDFYEFTNTFKKLQQHEIREQILHVGDVILELKNTMPGVKRVMNYRTEMLIDLTHAMKSRLSTADKRTRLRLKMNEDSAEMKLAIEQDEKAERLVQEKREELVRVKESMNTEFPIFEKESVQDVKVLMKAFARLQIKHESAKLVCVENALDRIKGIRPSQSPVV